MGRYNRQKDDNHNEIQNFFHALGAITHDVSMCAQAGCDFFAKWLYSPLLLIEVKNPDTSHKMTNNEKKVQKKFKENYHIIHTQQDVLELSEFYKKRKL